MADTSTHKTAQPAAKKHGRRMLLALLLAATFMLLALSGWLLVSTSGLQWLTTTATRMSAGRISLTGVSGTLLGSIKVQTVIIGNSDMRITAHDIQMVWRPVSLLSGKLEVQSLLVRDVEILSSSSDTPSMYPADLRLPLSLSVKMLGIDTLRIINKDGGTPIFFANNVSAILASNGRLHELQGFNAQLEYGTLTASGQLDGVRPYALQAHGKLAGIRNFADAEIQDAQISASASGNLEQLLIKAQGSGAKLSGNGEMRLTPYASFPLAVLSLRVSGLNPHAFSSNAPRANLTLQAELHSNADGLLEGDVSANNISPATLDRNGLPLLNARAHATLSADLLKFEELALNLAGGASISGHLDWQRNQFKGSADLAIKHLDPSALDTRLRSARLNGSMKLSGDDASQQGKLILDDGNLHLDALLTNSGGTLRLDKMRINRGRAELSGQGVLELGAQQNYSFSGKLQHFDLAAFLAAPRSDLNATLEMAGKLKPQTTGTARFMLSDSHFADRKVGGNGQIEFAGMKRGKVDAEVHLGDNSLSVRGGFGTASDKLQLALSAPALEQLGPGFGGKLNIQASVAGNWLMPDATLTLEGSKLAMPDGFSLATLTASAGLHDEALTLDANAVDYSSTMPAASIPLLTALGGGFNKLKITANGVRSLHEFDADLLMRNGSKLKLRSSGGFSDWAKGLESTRWQGSLTELSGEGGLPFKLRAAVPLMFAQNRIALGKAEFSVTGGLIHIDSLEWTPQRWHSKGDFTGIGLRAGIGFGPEFSANNEQDVLRLGGEWDITSAAQLSGKLRVARESGDWMLHGAQSLSLGLKTLQVTVSAADGRLQGDLSAEGERLGVWQANVAMPLAQSGSDKSAQGRAPLSGNISINTPDLRWLGPAISDNIRTAGRGVLNAELSGTLMAPRLNGTVHGDELALALLDQGVRLQHGTLVARIDHETLHIDTLNFVSPDTAPPRDSLLLGLNLAHEPGKIAASGTLDLGNKSGTLEFSASHMPLTRRADRWIVASGSGHIRFDEKNMLALDGNIIADAGLISQPVSDKPRLSDDIVIVGEQTVVGKGPRISVDATLDLGQNFYLRASGLEARLAGKLNVRDTPPDQQLRVTGTISTANASFQAYGQHLTVERGIVNFQGPLYDPGLNILALRKGLEVEAGVEVTGSALHPSVRLVSTPALPDFEKLSWIVLGRAPSAGGIDTSLLINAAGSILGEGSGGLTGQIKQTLGVDELSLRQGDNIIPDADANPLSNQIATVGKKLSARAYLSYEQGVTAVAGVTKLTYSLTPRVNIITQAGADNAINIFYTFSFD